MTGTQADRSVAVEGFKFAWPFPKNASRFYKIKSYAMMALVSTVSRLLFVAGVNKIVVHNKERFLKALGDKSRPLVTIANHRSNIDDPLMWNMISFSEFLRYVSRHRYTLAAHNICFSKQWHTNIFSLGRCVPCVRGSGVHQQGMDFSIEKLNENEWVHIFPEGKVATEPHRFKWGVGRLVMDSARPPIVLPIWCENMQSVWPVQPPYYPRFGHTINVHVGEPIDSASLLSRVSHLSSEEEKRMAITDSLQDSLFELGESAGHLAKGTAAHVKALEAERREKMSRTSE